MLRDNNQVPGFMGPLPMSRTALVDRLKMLAEQGIETVNILIEDAQAWQEIRRANGDIDATREYSLFVYREILRRFEEIANAQQYLQGLHGQADPEVFEKP